jgi:phosphonoacetaldehyde hydrolase
MTFIYQRSYRGPLQAVVFDWAGTINDYGCCAPAVVFVDVFKDKNIDITIAQAREPMGAAKRDHIEQITQMPLIAEQWKAVYGQPCTDADIDAMYQAFIPRQLAALAHYADLIPGALDTVAAIRQRGLKIGSCTGYNREMLDVCLVEAEKRGFEPDCAVSASDVPAGRPHPWMALKCAMELGVYPMESIVKIGDTVPDIGEGLNAGMWTIGLAVCGNEFGLMYEDVQKLDKTAYEMKRSAVYQKMYQAGAHYVVDSIADILPVLDEIQDRLARGERP